MKKIISLIISSFVFLILGCSTTQVINVDNSKMIVDPMKVSQVEKAIKTGAMAKGWRIVKIKNNLLEASILVRSKHTVVVTISYSNRGYKINYKDSKNLDYDSDTHTIHRSYNMWIQNLANHINLQLSNQL